jgi:hypothetical protein
MRNLLIAIIFLCSSASAWAVQAGGNPPVTGGGGGGGSGTVTQVGFTSDPFLSISPATTSTSATFNVGLSGNALDVAHGGTGLASGTSGGVPAFTAAGALTSSPALGANAVVIGGGPGATPTALGSTGTATTVLHGNASGPPSFSTISLATDTGGVLPTAKGGTGANVSSFTDGQLLIGNTAGGGLSAATLTAGSNITITNGAGTVTIASSGGGSSAFTSTGSTTSRLPADRAADVWNVADFGCVGDGTTAGAGTDNATALQAAVNAANAVYATSGQTVGLSLGSKLYALASAVTWKSGVMLYGPGGLVCKSASTYTGAMHGLITASAIVDFGFFDVQAWGVGPDRKIAGSCTDASTLGGRDTFVDVQGCTRFRVANCQLFRFMEGIVEGQTSEVRLIGNYINSLSSKTLAQLDGGTFTDYTFTGNPGAGIRCLGDRAGTNQLESDAVVITDNIIVCVGLDVGIDCTSQSGYPFRANVVGNYIAGTNSGIQIYTSGVAIPDPGTLTTTDRAANIAGNEIVWTRQQGIYIRGVEGVACTSNKVTRCALAGTFVGTSAGGILCRTSTLSTFPTSPVAHDLPVLIENNQVIDCGDPATGNCDAGIRCDTLACSIIGNQVVRSLDRFPTTLLSGTSFGISGLTTGGLDAWRNAIIRNNYVRGFNVGISASFGTRQPKLGTTVDIKGNRIAVTTQGINLNTSSSGYHIEDNSITETTSIGIYVKNTPYTTIFHNWIEAVPIGIQIASGSQASDYYVTGGRMGPTVQCDGNTINGATTPISINETATGDISVRGRCLTCTNNQVDGAPFYRDSTASFTYTAAPTVSDYRIWHIGDVAPMRTPTGAAQGWTCTTAGAFGAAIATTATTTAASATVTFSGTTAVVPDDYIAIAGVTGTKHVLSINVSANTCVVDVVCDASVSGAAITRPSPVFSNIVGVASGGTGVATLTNHGVLLGAGTGNVNNVAVGNTGQVLTGVTGADPVWAAPTGTVPTGSGFVHITSAAQDAAARAVDISTSDVTGTLPVAKGGTGAASFTNGQLLIGNTTGNTLVPATLTAGSGVTITNGAGTITIDASPASGATLGANNTFTGANAFTTSATPITVATGVGNAIAPPTGFSFTGGAHTNLTNGSAGTAEFLMDFGQTKTWGGSTSVANYSSFFVKRATLASTTATTAFTTASTMAIEGPPLAGANATASGALALDVRTGNVQIAGGTLTLKGAPQNINMTQSAASSGVSLAMLLTGGALTNQTASTETVDVSFALNRTVQHATGALTTQRAVLIQPPTYSFVASSTITTADTVAITGAPVAGSNATITTSNALHVQGGQTELAGPLLVDPQAAPGSPVDGQLWSDSTQQSLSTRSKGLTTPLVGTIFTATGTATVTTTTTETTILGSGVGTKTLPANFLVAGKTIRITVKGIMSNAAAETLRIKVKAGSTVLLDTTATTVSGTLTNAYFQASGSFTCRTTGGSGTVFPSGSIGYLNAGTGQGIPMVATAAVTLDTTASQALDVTATWGSASASDSISGQVVTIEAMN